VDPSVNRRSFVVVIQLDTVQQQQTTNNKQPATSNQQPATATATATTRQCNNHDASLGSHY
jgi:hypothetical protein